MEVCEQVSRLIENHKVLTDRKLEEVTQLRTLAPEPPPQSSPIRTLTGLESEVRTVCFHTTFIHVELPLVADLFYHVASGIGRVEIKRVAPRLMTSVTTICNSSGWLTTIHESQMFCRISLGFLV